jgi:outer membrane immunogenic protein
VRRLWIGPLLALVAAMLAAPTVARAQGTNWSGLYIGANAGEILNHDTGGDTCITPGGVKFGFGCSIDAGIGHMNAIGFLGGVQLGANWQGGPFVVGIEADYGGSTLQNASNFYGQLPEYGVVACCTVHYVASENMTSFQTERLRIGFASSQTLVYLTGGLAQANVTMSTNYAFSSVQYPGTTSIQRSGWTEGLGAEWALGSRLSFKVEGLLYTLQPYTTEYFSTGSTSGYQGGKDFYFHGAVARLGFNWKI